MTDYLFGHKIYWDEAKGRHRYCDNDALVPRNGLSRRKCPTCKMMPTKDGHDPCIATLPGVKYACCGHGIHEAYVMLRNGKIIRGRFDK